VLVIENDGRVKADTLVGDVEMNGVAGPESEADIDSIDLSMFDDVE
jgi:hypothetical protein